MYIYLLKKQEILNFLKKNIYFALRVYFVLISRALSIVSLDTQSHYLLST